MSTRPAAAKAKKRWYDPGWSWKVWGMIALIIVPTFGFALWVLAEAGGQTTIDSATLAVARQNAGGTITAITGTEHTVYHANAPLPDAEAPRLDGRPTLVWFTTSSCTRCEDELFVHEVAEEFRAALVFVEKEVGRETGDERLGVKEVPMFVFLDYRGAEVNRFGAIPSDVAFKSEIEAFLASR